MYLIERHNGNTQIIKIMSQIVIYSKKIKYGIFLDINN